MLMYLKYKLSVWNVLRKQRKDEAPLRRKIKRYNKTGDNASARDACEDMTGCSREFKDELEKLHTEYLMQTAKNLDIPCDQYKEVVCFPDEYAGPLSVEAKQAIRKAIREERRARREPFLAWAGWAVGILGALTGLVSVLKD